MRNHDNVMNKFVLGQPCSAGCKDGYQKRHGCYGCSQPMCCGNKVLLIAKPREESLKVSKKVANQIVGLGTSVMSPLASAMIHGASAMAEVARKKWKKAYFCRTCAATWLTVEDAKNPRSE